MTSKHDFPFELYYTPFTKTSILQKSQQTNKKHVILGDSNQQGIQFYVVHVDPRSNKIMCKTFRQRYKKKYGNLRYAGYSDVHCVHSYFVAQNKYIVTFCGNNYYNVYDTQNDKWLIKLNEFDKKLKGNFCYETCRSLLINDEIIVISSEKQMLFYSIAHDHIANPQLVHRYTLKNKNLCFSKHGMCCIEFKKSKTKDSKDSKNIIYHAKILLFGGENNGGFLSSFLTCKVSFFYQCFKSTPIITIDEQLVAMDNIDNKMNTTYIKEISKYDICNFGFECIFNHKKQPIIVIIGGYESKQVGNKWKRGAIMYNCITHEIVLKKTVEFEFECMKEF